MSRTGRPKGARKIRHPVDQLLVPDFPTVSPVPFEIEIHDGNVQVIEFSGVYEDSDVGFRLTVVVGNDQGLFKDCDHAEIVASFDAGGGHSAELTSSEYSGIHEVRDRKLPKIRFGTRESMVSPPVGLTPEEMTQRVVHGVTTVIVELTEDEFPLPSIDQLSMTDIEDATTDEHPFPWTPPIRPEVSMVTCVADAQDAPPEVDSFDDTDSSPVRFPPTEPSTPPTTHTTSLNEMLGPPGPKEINVSAPPVPPTTQSTWWKIPTVAAAFLAVLGVAGLAQYRSELSEYWDEKTEAAPEVVATISEPPVVEPIVSPPVTNETSGKPVIEVTPPVEPPVTEVTAVPPTAVPEPLTPPTLPVVDSKVPVTAPLPPTAETETTPPVVVTKPTAEEPKPEAPLIIPRTPPASTLPPRIQISGVGKKPMCTAECTWGNLNAEGLPMAVNGRKTVVCGDVTYTAIVTASKEKKYCWDAVSLQLVEPPTDPDPDGP